MTSLVPSAEMPDGISALRSAAEGATSISAAVAYVTDSGVDQLVQLIESAPQATLELCARGAPVTQQSALVRLRDQLGASVSVVMGTEAQRYHPKLWLFQRNDDLVVVAGSGNLTEGGLVANAEQFDVTRHGLDSAVAGAHVRRYEELTVHGLPLDEVMQSPAWYEWTAQEKKRASLQRQLQELDDRLAAQKAGGREEDKRALCEDLYALYDRTVAARLPRRDGKPYIPHYFKRGLDNACAVNNPVPFVSRVCRHQTEGFDVILAHGTADLTVEFLVVDEARPYHELFDSETRRLSEERLRQFSR